MNDSIWHDVTEKPDKSGSLVLFANGVIELVQEVTSWEEIKSKYNFSKWAYYYSFVMQNKIELVDTELLLEEELE